MRAFVIPGTLAAVLTIACLGSARAQEQTSAAPQEKPAEVTAPVAPPTLEAPAPAAKRPAKISKKLEAEFARGAKAYDQKNYEEALSIWLPLTAEGNARVLYNVGLMYANGLGTPKDDYVEAYRWFEISANRAEDPREKKKAERMRDMVGLELTPEQLAEAKARVKAWHPKWSLWR
jgi:TPR repeat protein